jgi:hypothetical protein
LGVRWIDRNFYPMSIRAAEGLNTREVLEAPTVLGGKKRLVRAKPMRVAVKKNGWPSIALHLLGEYLDVLIISGRFGLFRCAGARNHAQVRIFLSDWPIILEVRISLRE